MKFNTANLIKKLQSSHFYHKNIQIEAQAESPVHGYLRKY